METIKEFLENLKKTDTKVLNYEDFLNELKNTPERDITGLLKTNMLSPKKGLISIDTFLDNLFTDDNQGHFLSNPEIKDLENDTNYVYDDTWYTFNDEWYAVTDGMYTFKNDGNYLAHDINMKMFLNNNDDSYLVLLQVHTGLDERYGFSSYVVLKFDTELDYEDAFLDDSTDYDLASCLVETEEGSTLNITVSGRPFDCLAEMYAIDDDTFEVLFTTEIGYADLDNIKDEVKEYISSDKELSKKFHIKKFTDYDGNVYIAN